MEYTKHEDVTDAQSAVVSLQHVITRFQHDSDVVFFAGMAIADIAIEAAENGTIVDPLKGATDFLPAEPEICLCGAPMDDGWCPVDGCACSMSHTSDALD